ncbi:MAG: lactonase family protein [Saprospiraceae bacterium]|nr:lactonase family protein [Saprospiraceae bacterium]
MRTILFVGSFTDKVPGRGINIYEFNNETGEAKFLYGVDSLINSSFLRLSPDGKILYSVIESQMAYNGKVAAYGVDSLKGQVSLLSMQDCGGRNPVHLEIDKSGQFLVNSNYTDPGISIFKINSNGTLNTRLQTINFQGSSIIDGRQESAHIHSSNFSPDGQFLFSQDLGSDKIHRMKVSISREEVMHITQLGHLDVKPGSGPRHFTFHPNGKYAYGISELSGKLTAYHYKDENLEYIEDHMAYSKTQSIYRSADIHISPDGRFLYASNRGPEEDTIVIYSINLMDGTLELLGHAPTYGSHPRNFAIDPSGKFLLVANQFSNNITIFRRDLITGNLKKLTHEIQIDNPSSLQMRSYTLIK